MEKKIDDSAPYISNPAFTVGEIFGLVVSVLFVVVGGWLLVGVYPMLQIAFSTGGPSGGGGQMIYGIFFVPLALAFGAIFLMGCVWIIVLFGEITRRRKDSGASARLLAAKQRIAARIKNADHP